MRYTLHRHQHVFVAVVVAVSVSRMTCANSELLAFINTKPHFGNDQHFLP